MEELLSLGFVVCILAGLACFGLFVKCVDWFENI